MAEGLLGGVLPAVLSGGNELRRRLKGLLSSPGGLLGEMNEDAKTAQDQRRADFFSTYGRDIPGGLLGQSDPAWVQQQAQLGRDQLQNMVLNGLTVWHGSPHKFDKFDMRKIGTGEGAQAYGHGLYFAENQKVANDYAKNLSEDKITYFLNGKKVNPNALSVEEEVALRTMTGGAAPSKKSFMQELLNRKTPEQAKKFSDAWDKIAAQNPTFQAGYLYKSDLPDEAIAKMLDWDTPLSKQPEVWKKLKKSGYAAADDGKITGGEFHRRLEQELGADKDQIAAALKADGLPGIKYLDGNSRVTSYGPQDKGTRNFVVFDDQLPKILERNGGLLGK